MENLEALKLPDMRIVFDNIKQLPSIPVVVQQLISGLTDPNLSMKSLAKQISLDPSLSANVLKIANSAYYGAQRKVASVQDATVILGIDTIRSVAIMAGLIGTFPESSAIDRNRFWHDNIKTALCARAIADFLEEDTGVAYTVGALHTIGILVLDVAMRDKFAEVMRQSKQSGNMLLETERQMLGFDHAMVGAELARRWNFPYTIQHAIRYHDDPAQDPFEMMTGIVYVAHQLIEEDLDAEHADEEDVAALEQRLKLDAMQEQLQLDTMEFWSCLPSNEELQAQVELLLGSRTIQ
jgi:HD-like signal output (HDOD) protein